MRRGKLHNLLLVLPKFLTTLARLEKVAKIALELLVILWMVGPVLSEALVCHMKGLQRYFSSWYDETVGWSESCWRYTKCSHTWGCTYVVMSTACASWNNHLQLIQSVHEITRYLNRTIVLYRGKVRYFRRKVKARCNGG